MSLIVACPNCQTRYNLPQKFAGKKLKCKSCGKPFAASVGAARVQAGAQKQQAAKKVSSTDPDELAKMGIGAIRQNADPFAAPAHKGPDPLRNHVVQDPGFGMPSATDAAGMPGHGSSPVDPAAHDDGMGDVVANPYIKTLPKPVGRLNKKGNNASGRMQPTAVSAGDVMSLASTVFQNNLGILLGMTLLLFLIQIAFAGLQQGAIILTAQQDAAQVGIIVSGVIGLFGSVLQIFLQVGQTKVMHKLLRQKQAGFSEMFSGGSQFLPAFGASIVFGIACLIGNLLLIVPGIMIMVFFWPFYHLIVDDKAKAIESFGASLPLTKLNVGTTFVLGLASIGIMILGSIACGIGIFLAIPYVGLLWGAAYLMMSGQIESGA